MDEDQYGGRARRVPGPVWYTKYRTLGPDICFSFFAPDRSGKSSPKEERLSLRSLSKPPSCLANVLTGAPGSQAYPNPGYTRDPGKPGYMFYVCFYMFLTRVYLGIPENIRDPSEAGPQVSTGRCMTGQQIHGET